MKAENMWFGAVCGLLVFAVLFWAEPRRTVSAQARPASLAASPAGRFQVVELHPNGASERSGLLDTETGCTWTSDQTTPEERQQATGHVAMLVTYFSSVAFESTSFPLLSDAELKGAKTDGGLEKATITELQKEASLCDEVRVRALQAAAGR
jgi:hypothetical protein